MADEEKAGLKKTVLLCSGSKGGVGKSLQAGSFVDCLLETGIDVTLIDCDPANADSDLWGGKPAGRYFMVDVARGWDALLDTITGVQSSVFVVNQGAGDAPLFVEKGDLFRRVAAAEGWRVILSYLLSPSYGSIRALLQVAEAVRPWAEVVAFKNHYFPAEHLVLWHEVTVDRQSQVVVRDRVLELGVLEKDYPLLPGRVVLDAHRPGWTSLRDLERMTRGAYHCNIVDYRSAVRTILKDLKLL